MKIHTLIKIAWPTKNPIDVLRDGENVNDYIKTLADKYNIKLSPNDKWRYFEHDLSIGPDNVQYDGFTEWKNSGGYLEGKITYDDGVYMTNLAFINLKSPIEFASTMVHEAEHSKQEYFSDIGILSLPPYQNGGPVPTSFEAVTEADSYTIQTKWLVEHGQSDTEYYQVISNRARQYTNLVMDFKLNYTIPLFIFNSSYPIR